MDILKNRLESFTKPKRAKGTAKSQSNLKWPHPEYFIATPETLAEAGFYFDPNSDDKDLVTCYMCGKQLGEWGEKDDPFEIHYKKCGRKCAWANVRCGLAHEIDPDGRFVFTDKNRLPTSKIMEKARLDTFAFGQGWIHDQERNHGASSKKMAKAGFVFSPHDTHDDTAACLYCGISLSGWDADDDPTEEHRKRVKKAGHPCPMFPDIVFAPDVKSHSRSKSKSSHIDVTMPMKTYDGSDEDFSSIATTSTAKTPKASRTAKKNARTPGSRSSSRSRDAPVDDNDDEEPEEPGPPPSTRKTVRKPTTARSRSVSRTKSVASTVDSDAGTGTEDEIALTRSSSTRFRGKSKDTGDDGSGTAPTVPKKSRNARSKSKTRVSVIHENQAEDDDSTPPAKKKSLAKKASARTLSAAKSSSSSKRKQKLEEEEEEGEEEESPGDDRMRVDEPEPVTARPIRATRSTNTPGQAQERLGKSTNGERGEHSRTASTASTRGGRFHAPSMEEKIDDNDPSEDMDMHIPPVSTPSVEPEPESTVKEKQLFNSKTKVEQKPSSTSYIYPDFSEQDKVAPPIPPRSPSRPLSRLKPSSKPAAELEDEVSRVFVPKVEHKRTTSNLRIEPGSGDETSRPRSTKPDPPAKSASMTRKGSYLNSRTSTRSRAADQVLNISSDEDDGDIMEDDIHRVEAPAKTKSRILTNARTTQEKSNASEAASVPAEEKLKSSISKSVDNGTSKSTQARPTSNVFEEGSVQAKIAQIEKTVESEVETGERTSPFKPNHSPASSSNSINASEGLAQDVEMMGPADAPAQQVDSSLTRPAVTPPRKQQERSTSPFKTPFRFGGLGNPFSVPPTPGVPVDIPLGIPIPLSKDLFVPTQALSEAELNMTVEEWVRHHMQIEYAKFKEDAEREIAAFVSKAEQTKKTIEAL